MIKTRNLCLVSTDSKHASGIICFASEEQGIDRPSEEQGKTIILQN